MDSDVFPSPVSGVDYSLVLELLAAYPDRIDSGDFDGVGRLFESGSWNSRRGREESTAYLFRNMILYPDGTPRTRHLVGNVALSAVDDSTIDATSSIILMQQVEKDGPVLPSGVLDYRDRFVRTGDGWRFEHRDVKPLLTDFARHLRLPPPPPTGMPESTNAVPEVSAAKGATPDRDAVIAATLRDLVRQDARSARTRSVLTGVTVDLLATGIATVHGAVTVFEQADEGPIRIVDDSESAWRLRVDGEAWVVDEIAATRAIGTAAEDAPLPEPDRAAIERMIVSYGRLLDAGDLDGFAALFAAGRWDGLFGGTAVLERLTRIGATAGAWRHRVVNIVVEVDGDRAVARSVLWILAASEQPCRIVAVNNCSDRFERNEHGVWIWRERSISPRLIDAADGPLVW